jgi:uncharacterized protein YjiS (DUF1127 family)
MPRYIYGQSVAAFAGRQSAGQSVKPSDASSVSWRGLFGFPLVMLRTWLQRRRERQELLRYMASDHRATADMGININNARDWAERPFWQA